MSTLWLDEIGDADRARVGAKAHVLARLRREGLRVPDGFVLEAGRDLDEERRATLVEAYERLGGVVAVRSSSTAEDLDDASFAGQYRTFLAVQGREAVVEAAVGCLASASGGREYARALGTLASPDMAVLVHRFVEPRAAGVAFTRHPQDASAMLVESHAGRGEAVVSGSVRPDAYVLDHASGARRSGPTGGSLSDADLLGVADLSRRVESILGAPQDVEWAIGPEGLALLQARPITVEPDERADASARRLTRANVGEVLPDPVTPLTWSTVCGFLEHGFQRVARRAGIGGDEGRFLVLYRRRLYLNLTLSVRTGMRLPGMTWQAAERLILGGGSPERAEKPRLGLSTLPALAVVGFRLAALARRLPEEVDAACARVAGLAGSAIEDADEAGLRRLLRVLVEAGQEIGDAHIATSGTAALRLALLGRLVERWCAGDPSALVNRLVAGLPGVASAVPTLDLESLAAEVRQREDWASWLRERSPEQAARRFAEGAAPPDLAARLEAFLRSHGHRAVSEGELAATTWRDDPSPVFAALGPLVASARSPGFGHRSRASTRDADEEALLFRLGPIRRGVLRFFLAGAQAWVRERERTKSAAVALVDHGRRLVRAAARRLVASGKLRDAADVYFLTLSEIVCALDGQGPPAGVVERRRRRHEREALLAAPREVDLDAPEEEAAGPSAGGLVGIAASAGVGAGPARVLLPGEPARIEPGEVLVAPVLDAALGPLLASAAAAVAEIGGILSHGSVVARELGVPCVVDVRDATRRIRPGERLLVDGDAGRVSVLTDDAAAEGPGRAFAPRVVAADPADERLHPPESDPRARESIYMNAQDATTGVHVVATVGVRRGVAGEALVALGLSDGRVLFGLDRGDARAAARGFSVGGSSVGWTPTRLQFEGRLAVHEAAQFPPWPPVLVLAPRTASVSIDLVFRAMTPAVDLCETLSPEARRDTLPLGRHHVEQSGRWVGEVRIDGATQGFDGTGSRDHSWGLRDWDALDHSRLFALRVGDDLGLHALALSVRGRHVEGGFLWEGGRLETVTRIDYAAERRSGRVAFFELEVTTGEGRRRSLRGVVERTLTIPVQVERRLSRIIAGRPYGMVLHEGFTRFEMEGRTGHGIAEFTERPR